MSCILCFLEDSFQEKVRIFSQSKSDRFEAVLNEFQNNFLNEFYFLTSVEDCKRHNQIHDKTKIIANDTHDRIKKLTDVKEYFNSIRNIYTTWVKGQNSLAANDLKKILGDKKILKSTDKLNKLIFFRGRKSGNILTKEELFHIPFNKRYLIQNQRYSVTGQPLLYLGLCPLDVVYELRENIENLENIYFCSLVHASDEQLSILDVTNEFPDFFTNYNILFNDDMGEIDNSKLDVESDFYKFILSQVCSFKRSRWSEKGAFAEEYVIPQLLTEVLRTNGFGGILFSSTRVDTKKITSKSTFRVNRYRENLALFTKYEETNNYDYKLFNQFIISKPITIDELIDVSLEDWSNLTKQIGKILHEPNIQAPFPLNISEITGISTKTRFENLFITDGKDEINYFIHKIGKLHLQLICQTVLDLRNKMKSWL